MLLKALLPSLLAAVAMGFPTLNEEPDTDLNVPQAKMHKFKRDSVLETRDLELAELHGVNLTEMYKHSLIERDDGDHVVIWVDRSFVDEDDQDEEEKELVKRQQRWRIANGMEFGHGFSDHCRDHKRQDHTGPNGPYSGGVLTMYQWARAHSGGYFRFRGWDWHNLFVAGSNSGANALYKAKILPGGDVTVGTQDLRNDADWTYKKRRKFGSSWRASSKGGETCNINTRINYQLVRTKYAV